MSRVLTAAAVLAALATPPAAFGAEALSPPVPGPALTRYGARYETPAGASTHRGLDLGAGEGATVSAAADGVVTFAGLVPADGGGRTTAVTITTPGGLLVTVSPLEAASVDKGAHVVAGDEVGTLAGTGDASCAQPHVHLSVRIDGAYVDPEPMLAAGHPEPEPAPVPQPAAAPQPMPQPTPQPTPQPAASPASVVAARPVAGAHSQAAGVRVAAASSAPAAPVRTSVGAAVPEARPEPAAITLKALEAAQARLRAGAGATSAARASHIAPEMLRAQQPALTAPHLSGARTASVGVLLAAAAGLALWGAVDRRALATARGGAE